MDISAISERLYYHTSGYPFLVSKLCKNIVEDILPKKENKNEWTLNDVEASVQILLLENNTNFDDLIKNLENHQDLYDLVFRIVVDGVRITFNPHNATISKGILYGVFKRNGSIKSYYINFLGQSKDFLVKRISEIREKDYSQSVHSQDIKNSPSKLKKHKNDWRKEKCYRRYGKIGSKAGHVVVESSRCWKLHYRYKNLSKIFQNAADNLNKERNTDKLIIGLYQNKIYQIERSVELAESLN